LIPAEDLTSKALLLESATQKIGDDSGAVTETEKDKARTELAGIYEQYPSVIQDALVDEGQWRKLLSLLVSLGPRPASTETVAEISRRRKLLGELFGESTGESLVSCFKTAKVADSAGHGKRKLCIDDSSPVPGGSMDIDEREAAIASLKRKKRTADKEVNIS
jgi:hypothetical protein